MHGVREHDRGREGVLRLISTLNRKEINPRLMWNKLKTEVGKWVFFYACGPGSVRGILMQRFTKK